MIYRVKDTEFVDPFTAETPKEAAMKALSLLGFSFMTEEEVKEKGAISTLKRLGFSLERI